MKTIGLIGGMTWLSTAEYYRIINETVQKELGSSHSAKILLYSLDFNEVEKMQISDDWAGAGRLLGNAAQRLEKGGADFFVICANTMHKVADDVKKSVKIPILHILDAVIEAVKGQGLKKVGLLGTKFTMEGNFYKNKLTENGIEVLIPEPEARELIHAALYKEIARGMIKESTKAQFRDIIQNLVKKGAQGVILGCTEIPLLVKQKDFSIPIFDTTEIHATAAAKKAIEK